MKEEAFKRGIYLKCAGQKVVAGDYVNKKLLRDLFQLKMKDSHEVDEERWTQGKGGV